MDEQLKSIENQIERRNFESPPLDKWHPPLSGDIPIRITADGTWFHDGGAIKRESIVNLFAALLRREEDGEYYLITPGEKWRIEVERYPLVVVDTERVGSRETSELVATLNTGKQVTIDAEHPLSLDQELGGIAVMTLDHGLSAVFSRAAWYRLVDMAVDSQRGPIVTSGNYQFNLQGYETG